MPGTLHSQALRAIELLGTVAMLGATRNICVVANEFEQLNESTKTKCAEDRQVTSRQNMMTGGSFVDSTTQIDGQRITTPSRYPRIHKTIGKTRSDIYNLVRQTEKTEQNSSKSLHLAPCLEKNRRLINKSCHVGERKQTIKQSCHVTSIHTSTSLQTDFSSILPIRPSCTIRSVPG